MRHFCHSLPPIHWIVMLFARNLTWTRFLQFSQNFAFFVPKCPAGVRDMTLP